MYHWGRKREKEKGNQEKSGKEEERRGGKLTEALTRLAVHSSVSRLTGTKVQAQDQHTSLRLNADYWNTRWCLQHTIKQNEKYVFVNSTGYYVRTETAERLETWGGGGGGSSYTKQSTYSCSNFPKCPLRSSLAQTNLFAILTVLSSVSVIDLW